MRIREKDLFHGAALTRIVEHPSFTALNKADEKYGHYQINLDKRVLAKHTADSSQPWQFTFQPDDLEVLSMDIEAGVTTYVCLVCGETTICLLNQRQLQAVLDLESDDAQWVRVELPKGGSMRVRGSNGEVAGVIRHNAFPKAIF